MLLLGKTLGLTPIKTNAKEGTESLKKIHFQINDVLFAVAGKYLFRNQAANAFDKLCALGKELKELDVPEKARPKKAEILEQLRVRCNSLKQYKQQNQTLEDVETMQKALGFEIHKFIEQKDNLTPEKALALLAETKELYDCIFPFEEKLKVENFIRVNTQLLDYISKTFGIRQ